MTEKLNPNQRKALSALITHKTIEEAAQSVGLSSRTLYRYLAQPEFRAELANEGKSLIAAASIRLLNGQDKALEALENMIDALDHDKTNRRLAAQAWLNLCTKIWDTNIEDRITALEEAILHERK